MLSKETMTIPKGTMFPIKAIDAKSDYYALTLGADENGGIWTEAGETIFAGFDDTDERIEIRHLSVVNAKWTAGLWKDFQEPFVVVNTSIEWAKWCIGGGHALIKSSIVKKHMPWELGPRRCVIEGMFGFTPLAVLPKTAFNRAPTPKLRMKVMERDKYRCVLCGRRASDHVDVEIHIHHIRPISKRGITTARNLVSLCHTCHHGLDPHFNWDLYEFTDQFLEIEAATDLSKHRDAYFAAVDRYRKTLVREFTDTRDKNT